MKKSLLSALFTVLISSMSFAQTNLIVNGDFETNPPFTGWASSNANGNLWAGQGNCTGSLGPDYAWIGTQAGTGGLNNVSEDMYQTVSISSSATAAELIFDAAVNTDETGTISYDRLDIWIQNTSGTVLGGLGYIDNTFGDPTLSNCQTWSTYAVDIPTTYWGSTFRIVFEFTTDGSAPTIFRLDDVQLLVTQPNCNYSLSAATYNVPDNLAGTYNNIATMSVNNGCAWSANVVTGGTWLTCTSSGSGNGNIGISVTENTTGSARTGTISVAGNTITVVQPAFSCDYTVSPVLFNCPDHLSGTLTNIAIVNTGAGCLWDADVVEGSSWLVSNSDGTQSGAIDITVLLNNSDTSRTGRIIVGGETLLIVQPADPALTGVNDFFASNVKVFPNPATTQLTIESDEALMGSPYQVFDLSGRVVVSGQVSSTLQNVDLSALKSGVYHLSITGESEVIQMKFVKS